MVKVRVVLGKVHLEVDAEDVKSSVKQLSGFMDVYAEQQCGACGCQAVRVEHRSDADSHDYYSVKCLNGECGAELRFGQHKSGKTLFAKRKDEQGNWLDHGGWMKFQRQPRRDE